MSYVTSNRWMSGLAARFGRSEVFAPVNTECLKKVFNCLQFSCALGGLSMPMLWGKWPHIVKSTYYRSKIPAT